MKASFEKRAAEMRKRMAVHAPPKMDPTATLEAQLGLAINEYLSAIGSLTRMPITPEMVIEQERDDAFWKIHGYPNGKPA